MKNLTEILGGAQILLDISFAIQTVFEDQLSDAHKALLVVFRQIEEYAINIAKPRARTGRPSVALTGMFRAYIIKTFFQINKTVDLIRLLKSDANLRLMCGFKKVPSAATFSRTLKEFSTKHLADSIHALMVTATFKNELVHTDAIDSTIIHAREKAQNSKRDVKVVKVKKKPGRKKKGEVKEVKPDSVLTVQRRQSSGKSLSRINKEASWACKQNSQGKVQYSKGYKLHLSVDGNGIPLAAVVTGANVHDSQVAIPLLKMTRKRTTILYAMADSAYDAPQVKDEIGDHGSVPIVDRNKRRSLIANLEDPVRDQLYKNRTVVERANSHLKGSFLPTALYIKGYEKVNFVVMLAVLIHTAIKILQYFILPARLAEV